MRSAWFIQEISALAKQGLKIIINVDFADTRRLMVNG
jgi:hypothetical protein